MYCYHGEHEVPEREMVSSRKCRECRNAKQRERHQLGLTKKAPTLDQKTPKYFHGAKDDDEWEHLQKVDRSLKSRWRDVGPIWEVA